MNYKDLLHKRVLVAAKETVYRSANSTVVELLIMEVSPSGNFIKVRDMDGRRYWKSADIILVEVLATVEKYPKDGAQ